MSDKLKILVSSALATVLLLLVPFVIFVFTEGNTTVMVMYYVIVFFVFVAASFFAMLAVMRRLEKLEREMKIQLAALAFTLSELKNASADAASGKKD